MLAVLSGTAGWLLITSSLPRLPAAMSSLLLLLQPAGALVLADVVLREQPTVVQVIGAVAGLRWGCWPRAGPRGPAVVVSGREHEPVADAPPPGRLAQARTANST